ncbi:equilibrative nucleobase transporter 1-like [Amphiura filiformis]|uniref:equilibrative nucleobase transporter 1-like n=1 Tax=Amphiura filiformis TaxID=82378 RepID=UPI003B223C7A
MGQRQRFHRYAPIGLGVGELLFYGGPIYGWATLVYVLKADGYYSNLCTNETAIETTNDEDTPATCGEQDAILNLVFTVGIFSLCGSEIFTGLLFDYFGTRFLRLLLHLLVASGLIMMAFSSPSIPVLLFPGMVCISIGGIAILFTNMQIGNLFGNHRATVMTLLNGCLDSSSFVMLLIKLGYEGGISIRIAFATLAGATFCFFINTFVFLPKRHIPWPLPPDYGKKKKDNFDAEKVEDQVKENGPSETTNDESGSPRGPYEDIRDSGLAFTVTTLSYVVFSISNVIPVIEVLYVTYLLHVITRGFMYALAAAAMPIFFPSQYFGTLFGLLMGLSSIIGLLQFPLFIVSQTFFDNDPLVVNLILLGACMLTIVLPIYIHFYAKRANQQLKEMKKQRNEMAGIDNPVMVEDIII